MVQGSSLQSPRAFLPPAAWKLEISLDASLSSPARLRPLGGKVLSLGTFSAARNTLVDKIRITFLTSTHTCIFLSGVSEKGGRETI